MPFHGRRGLLGLAALVLGAAPVRSQSLAAVDAAVRSGIASGLYPGAVVVIGRRDSILYARGYGHFTWDADSPVPRPDSTIWDLASITKVVGTASAAMRLIDARKLELDAPVSRYLPRFRGGGKERVTVRMLLDHTSGLRSYAEFYRRTRNRNGMIELLYAEELQRTPGDSAVYSDLNALLLGLTVEQVAGRPLDEFVAGEVFRPLGMSRTMYRPPRSLWRHVVPNATWRGEPVRGQVHDQNAARFGGVAGHAGVFSTGMDLARYAQMWLRGGKGPDGTWWVRAPVIRAFLARGPRSGSRLLGWDTRDPLIEPPSVFGSLVSDAAYGHTGWTGTEIWIDPSHDLFLVFLTNRSYDPKVRDSVKAMKQIRADVSDAVVRLVPRVCDQDLVARC